MTKSQIINCATAFAEDTFDKQMLDLIELIKKQKKFHMQHKTMLLNYCEAHKRALK